MEQGTYVPRIKLKFKSLTKLKSVLQVVGIGTGCISFKLTCAFKLCTAEKRLCSSLGQRVTRMGKVSIHDTVRSALTLKRFVERICFFITAYGLCKSDHGIRNTKQPVILQAVIFFYQRSGEETQRFLHEIRRLLCSPVI